MPKFVENDVGKSSFFDCFFWGLGVKRSQFSKKARPWKSSENHGGLVKNRLSHGSLLGKRSSKNQQISSSIEVANIIKKLKNQQKSMEKWKSTKNRLPRPILVNFWWILGPFWAPKWVKNQKKQGSIFRSKKGCEKRGQKSSPRRSDDLWESYFGVPGLLRGLKILDPRGQRTYREVRLLI